MPVQGRKGQKRGFSNKTISNRSGQAEEDLVQVSAVAGLKGPERGFLDKISQKKYSVGQRALS